MANRADLASRVNAVLDGRQRRGRAGVRCVTFAAAAAAVLGLMEPDYPDEARKAKYQGTVLFNVVIDETGQVTNIQVARSLALGLDEKAIDAVKQWRFKPATKDGRPVSAPTQVEVTFRLL